MSKSIIPSLTWQVTYHYCRHNSDSKPGHLTDPSTATDPTRGLITESHEISRDLATPDGTVRVPNQDQVNQHLHSPPRSSSHHHHQQQRQQYSVTRTNGSSSTPCISQSCERQKYEKPFLIKDLYRTVYSL